MCGLLWQKWWQKQIHKNKASSRNICVLQNGLAKARGGTRISCSQTWPRGSWTPLWLVGSYLICLNMVKALTNHLLYSRNDTIHPYIHPTLLEYMLSSSLWVVWLYTLGHAYKLEGGLLSTSLHTARISPKHWGGDSWASREPMTKQGSFLSTSESSPTLAFGVAHQSDLSWDASNIREGSVVGFEFDLFLAKFPC